MLTIARKTEWLRRLRSAEFTQCKYIFRRGKSCFCALGLLADIINPSWSPYFTHIPLADLEEDEGEYAYPAYFGISEYAYSTIVKLNDHENRTFIEIAEWVEANVKAV